MGARVVHDHRAPHEVQEGGRGGPRLLPLVVRADLVLAPLAPLQRTRHEDLEEQGERVSVTRASLDTLKIFFGYTRAEKIHITLFRAQSLVRQNSVFKLLYLLS